MPVYTPQTWNDAPSTLTPVDAARLGHIEAGLADASATAYAAQAAAAAAGGGMSFNTVSSSTDYVASANTLVKVNAAGGNRTVTIPVTAKAVVCVVKTDSSANKVFVTCSGTIDGDTNAEIDTQWTAVTFVGDGTNAVIQSVYVPGGTTGGGGSGAGVGSILPADSTIVVAGTSAVTVKANVGVAAGTVAAGNDTRITGAAQKGSNLADLTNPATARANLGGVPVLPATSTGTKYLRDDGVFAVPAGGGGGSGTAAGTTFDPTGTDLTSTDVQDAIVELDTLQASTEAAAVAAVMAAGVVLAPSLLPAYTTAGRPASGAAYPIYRDTTTNKIGFWDGTVWRDAMGTAI